MCALRVLIYKGVISFVAKLACTHWASGTSGIEPLSQGIQFHLVLRNLVRTERAVVPRFPLGAVAHPCRRHGLKG